MRLYALGLYGLPKPFKHGDSVRLDIGGQEPYDIRIENFTLALLRDVQETWFHRFSARSVTSVAPHGDGASE